MLITCDNAVCFHVHVDENSPDNILKDVQPVFLEFWVEQVTTLLCQLVLDFCLHKYP